VAIDDSDVAVQFAAGKAEMRVDNLSLDDYHNLPNALAEGPSDPATVSFDVVWSSPITRRVHVLDGTLGNNYAGNYVENAVTVTWSGKNLATGFTFTANPGTFATSFLHDGFAELGHERNGRFFPGGDPVLAAANPQEPVSQTLTMQQLQPVLQNAIAGWQAAGASATQVEILNGVQAHIATLPSSHLGEEAGGEIWISPNAGGWGWYTDTSPAANQAFPAAPGSPDSGKMDLLSVVSHELGHVLGLQDSENTQDVMGETLAPGVRRLPTVNDVFATGVEPTAASSASAGALLTVPAPSSSLANHGDQDMAALLASILAVPPQTMFAPAVGNQAPATNLVPYDSPPPARMDARSQDAGATLSLAPQSPLSSTIRLDQVLAAVAAQPLDPSIFNDPLVPYSG
jgi:hypothetical protein